MKKIIYFTAIVCLLTLTLSCKSSKAGKKDSKNEAVTAPVETEEMKSAEDAESGGSAGEETALAADNTDSKAKAPATDAGDSENQDFTGWIKSSKKNINERYGKIQLRIKSGIGSYTIAALNENDKPVQVLSKANEYVTNAFYLKTSKKIYNLVTDRSVRVSTKKTSDGARILYEIPSVAQVTVNFSCLASDKNKDSDMVKVTVSIKNISTRNEEYSFKSVLDTVLGEAAAYHFYTFEDVPVKSEVLYRTLQNQKWFVSKNLNGVLQLFFTGADCTTPELVALANYSTLEKNTWEPDMMSYRVFDTVLSYNNSAVCTIWKPIKIAPSESGKIVYYLALSGDGRPASGEKYIYSKDFKNSETKEKALDAAGPKLITSYSDEQTQLSEPEDGVTELKDESSLSDGDGSAEIPYVDFNIQNMTPEHLTPEYIQSLLDRIAELEEDTSSVNRQELLQLNAELDAILNYLRQ